MKKVLTKLTIWILVFSFFIEATPVWALTKEENIYTKLNSNGRVNNSYVYEHIYGSSNNLIQDKSSLSNIENISGKEKYIKDDKNLTWEANGNDIYYTGTIAKDLPISMNIKYYLNDEEFDAKDILGKKGHIRIVIKYENHLKKQVIVNGKIETLYTPFVVATTSLLSNENNKNIKVTNGKVINNGMTSIVVGISSPGLYESLDLNELKGFDTIEISYDTKSFELSSMYAIATSKILDNSDLNIFNKLKDLYSAINELQSNMDLLVDGSKQIANGTNELNKAISIITNKYYSYRNLNEEDIINKITPLIYNSLDKIAPALQQRVANEAANVIKSNKEEMTSSITDMAINNTKNVIEGEINKLISNIDFDEIIGSIVGTDLLEEIRNDENIENETKAFINDLKNQLLTEIGNAANGTINEITSLVTLSQEDIEEIAQNTGLTEEQVLAVTTQATNKISGKISVAANNLRDNINNTINNLSNQEYLNALIRNYVTSISEKITNTLDNYPNLNRYQQELRENITNYLKKELSQDELIRKYLDAEDYVNKVVDEIIDDTASDIADKYTVDLTKQIINNIINEELNNIDVKDELSKILNEYKEDINSKLNIVDDNIDKLTNGVSMLNSGANQLSKGLEMYNDQGIKKISGLVNGNVKSLTGKIEALTKLSNDYKTLDDINDKDNGKSKIIFMVDSLKKVEDKKITTEKIVEKETIWDKIKGLFK